MLESGKIHSVQSRIKILERSKDWSIHGTSVSVEGMSSIGCFHGMRYASVDCTSRDTVVSGLKHESFPYSVAKLLRRAYIAHV